MKQNKQQKAVRIDEIFRAAFLLDAYGYDAGYDRYERIRTAFSLYKENKIKKRNGDGIEDAYPYIAGKRDSS